MSGIKGFSAKPGLGVKVGPLESVNGHYEISLGVFGEGQSRNGISYSQDIGKRIKHMIANRILSGKVIPVNWPPSLDASYNPLKVPEKDVLGTLTDIALLDSGGGVVELVGKIRTVGYGLRDVLESDALRSFSVGIHPTIHDSDPIRFECVVMDNTTE